MYMKPLYPAMEAADRALAAVYDQTITNSARSFDLTRMEAFLLTAVPAFEPDFVSTSLLRIRSPYTAASHYDHILAGLHAKGLLEQIKEGEYQLTQKGRVAVQEIMRSIYAVIAGIRTLPVTDLMDLASRLKDLADACYNAHEPPGKWCIQHARKMDPGAGAPVMVRVDQFLTELLSYRDDAHLAAWSGYGTNGHAWDVFTLLWSEGGFSIEEINKKLARRGNSLEDTTYAVEQLVKKGWAIVENNIYKITPFGADIRKIAEETTDRYFYSPFRAFNETEIKRTIELLDRHRRGIPQS